MPGPVLTIADITLCTYTVFVVDDAGNYVITLVSGHKSLLVPEK